jgi:hypothetical protein
MTGAMLLAVTVFGDDVRGWEVIVVIAAVAMILGNLSTIWQKGAVPLWHLVTGTVKTIEAHPILLNIAHEFEPNDGHSLRDRIDKIDKEILEAAKERQRMHEQLEEIDNKIDLYLIDRLPGGRRHYDPPDNG